MKHGPLAKNRGPIGLTVETKGDLVIVTIENPGTWRGPRDGGNGLPIVRKRLGLAYGDRASLAIASTDDDRTRAVIALPMR